MNRLRIVRVLIFTFSWCSYLLNITFSYDTIVWVYAPNTITIIYMGTIWLNCKPPHQTMGTFRSPHFTAGWPLKSSIHTGIFPSVSGHPTVKRRPRKVPTMCNIWLWYIQEMTCNIYTTWEDDNVAIIPSKNGLCYGASIWLSIYNIDHIKSCVWFK